MAPATGCSVSPRWSRSAPPCRRTTSPSSTRSANPRGGTTSSPACPTRSCGTASSRSGTGRGWSSISTSRPLAPTFRNRSATFSTECGVDSSGSRRVKVGAGTALALADPGALPVYAVLAAPLVVGGPFRMILRIDRLPIELPEPKHPSPNSAAAVQELLGGRFGEMSTLMNYTMQSFNFRGRTQARPFYDLIANIAAEEYSHIELVSYTINLLLTGTTKRDPDPVDAPLAGTVDARNSYHFIASGQQALPVDSMGQPWTGQNVFSSGNLKLDLLHNFFLECGARANKIRV